MKHVLKWNRHQDGTNNEKKQQRRGTGIKMEQAMKRKAEDEALVKEEEEGGWTYVVKKSA